MSNTTTKPTKFLDIFRSLDQPTKDALADLPTPLLMGFAALALAAEQSNRNQLSAEQIVAALEAAGVATQREAITRAFSRAGDRITRQNIDDELFFTLMTRGRREIEPLLRKGTIGVSYIDAGQPRAARKTLGEMFSQLTGHIRICDPFYGAKSLDSLELIPLTCMVYFLTAQWSDRAATATGTVQDFYRARPQTQIRIVANPHTLHDRYVISDTGLLLLGHGIKDIGTRDSFIVSIGIAYAEDLLAELRSSFDTKWGLAIPV